MCVPQACLLACDVAVGLRIKLLKTAMEVVVVEQVEYLTTVKLDRVDEVFRVVKTRQGQRHLVRIRIRARAKLATVDVPSKIVGATIKKHHAWWQGSLV